MSDERKKSTENESGNSLTKPDPETMHTTDPQENMEGPVSSLMQETGEAFDTGTSEKEANKEREQNM